MTYTTGEMVLPKNAVAMDQEEMRYVEGGYSWTSFFKDLLLGETISQTWVFLKTVAIPAATKLFTGRYRKVGWNSFTKQGQKYQAYWDGKKFTKIRAV